MSEAKIILAGGSGFLGAVLAKHFAARGREVLVLTRTPKSPNHAIREVGWDGETLGAWTQELEGAQALVNLAGVSVNCRYHARNRQLILDSRVNSTRVLGEAVARCVQPPTVWLNSSTATIYKHTFLSAWDETGDIGGTPEAQDEFSVEVAVAWERAFNAAPAPKTRKLILRTAMVLGEGRNSVFPVLCRLVRLGLGGSLAGGGQFVSWIHERDFCRAVDWLIDDHEATGVFNLTAPNPVTNAEMMRTLRELCGRPFGLPATAWMLEFGAILLRTETELVIKSRRVVPGRLLKEGFVFEHPLLGSAFVDLLQRTK